MEQIINWQMIQEQILNGATWLKTQVLVLENLIQFAVMAAILPVSVWVGKKIKKGIKENIDNPIPRQFRVRVVLDELVDLIPFLSIAFFTWASGTILNQLQLGTAFLNLCQTFILVWVWIKLAASVILDRFWSKALTLFALAVAICHILGLLVPVITLLESIGFVLGGVQLTLLTVIKALILIFVLLKLGMWASDQFETKIKSIDSLTPSAHVLVSKAIKITIISLVCIVSLTSIGVDLSAFAVFGGAIGVGIGFGLQKVVANFISGIILLVDKSIKPGDVIQIGDVYGWVSDFKGRYASVVTRDGKEYLIPNEDMITQQVINWSYTHSHIRVKIPVGISYDDDPHLAGKLMREALTGVDRVLEIPKPNCLLKGFGDNSVDLELRFWIKDPQNGMANIKSQVMLNIWDIFKANQIQIPYPQRDIHFDPKASLTIKTITEQNNT